MNATKQVTTLGLAALALGLFALPALADYDSFRTYDHHGNGRWGYQEFRDANHDYYRHHRSAVILDDNHLRHEFRNLDRDNDGFVRVEEVRRYRSW